MERFVFLLVFFLSTSVPGAAQLTLDTSARERNYLKELYKSSHLRYPDLMVIGREDFQRMTFSEKDLAYPLVRGVWKSTRSIPGGLALVGVGKGRTQTESVNAALEDLGLKLSSRVRTRVVTRNDNGKTSLNAITATDTDFPLPPGATKIYTEKSGKKEYTTRVVLDISAYLAGVEEKIGKIHHNLCLALAKFSFKNAEEKKRKLAEAWNGYCISAYNILDNPISDQWSPRDNLSRKLSFLTHVNLNYGIMYATPDTADPFRILPKVFPTSLADLSLAYEWERNYIEHHSFPIVFNVGGYQIYVEKGYKWYPAEERLKTHGWKTL